MNLDDTALVVERITNRTSYQPFGLPVSHSLSAIMKFPRLEGVAIT
jgi:hypothetical protein